MQRLLTLLNAMMFLLISGCDLTSPPASPTADDRKTATGRIAAGATDQSKAEPDFDLSEPAAVKTTGKEDQPAESTGASGNSAPSAYETPPVLPRTSSAEVAPRLPLAGDTTADDPKSGNPKSADSTAGDQNADNQTNSAETSPVDPLIQGLEFPNVDIRELFAKQKADYEKTPTDAEAATKFIGLIQSLGIFREEQGDKEIASTAFRQCLQMVEKAVADGVVLDAELVSSVYFHEAMLLAGEGQAAEALKFLRQAVAGKISVQQFDDLLETVSTGKAMTAVRELTEFPEQMQAWKSDLNARYVELAKSDLINGESFPLDFSVTDVLGKPVRLAEYRGKVCVVDVWGTWCGPCIKELPSFIRLQESYGASGFQMIGLNEESGDDPQQTVSDYISKAGINYPCALINEEIHAQIPNFDGYPTTIFVDRHGKVRLKVTGAHADAYLETIVQILLAEPPPAENL